MSASMKKPHTDNHVEITIHGTPKKKFIISRKDTKELISFLSSRQISEDDNELVPADEVFKDLHAKYGKIGSVLRGYRFRDNITQAELAKKLDILQSHVSQMEHSKRPIGKKMAQKLAKIFRTDYRLFL